MLQKEMFRLSHKLIPIKKQTVFAYHQLLSSNHQLLSCGKFLVSFPERVLIPQGLLPRPDGSLNSRRSISTRTPLSRRANFKLTHSEVTNTEGMGWFRALRWSRCVLNSRLGPWLIVLFRVSYLIMHAMWPKGFASTMLKVLTTG